MGRVHGRDRVVMARLERGMTIGCLTVLVVLIVVLGTVLGALWYWSWHTDKVNAEHRQQALLALDDQLRRTKNETLRALGSEGSADLLRCVPSRVQGTRGQAGPVRAQDALRYEPGRNRQMPRIRLRPCERPRLDVGGVCLDVRASLRARTYLP
ncbi:hypothetical protein [Streptomyces sp. NPDC051129]|uniref:hypothetical protein n=1 Tax=Streptomyces sp. NPDC051129 TaxID=3154639 RepID=UPI003423CB67